MELMTGKYIIKNMENTDIMTKEMGIPVEMMNNMVGAPGMILEMYFENYKMTMRRSDGLTFMFRIGEEFEMHMRHSIIQVLPEIEEDVLSMTMTMPDGRMAGCKYHFDKGGMVMEITLKNKIMKVIYKRI